MSTYVKIILILFGLAYLISPVDLIPELLIPWVGWIDDSLVLWCVYYLIRYGELPWFFFKKKQTMGRPSTAFEKKEFKKQSSRPNRDQARDQDQARAKPKATPSVKSAHEILGVSVHASWKEIQLAYKEKIKQYHPDKLSHLGKEFSTLANEKFLEIQAAYDDLKRKRNK